MAAEEWLATCKDRHDKFYSFWVTWIYYTGKALPGISNSPIWLIPYAKHCQHQGHWPQKKVDCIRQIRPDPQIFRAELKLFYSRVLFCDLLSSPFLSPFPCPLFFTSLPHITFSHCYLCLFPSFGDVGLSEAVYYCKYSYVILLVVLLSLS